MAETQSRFMQVGENRFQVREWGSSGRSPLVLLHGLASSSHMFDLIASAFADDYHVIAFDQRGHGESSKPDGGYDFETIAGDLDRLTTVLGLGDAPLIVAGHSWGGYSALYYAATRPQRVKCLILLDGGIARLRDQFPTWAEAESGMSPPSYVNRTLDDIRRMVREDWLGPIIRPELEPLAMSIFDTSDPNDVRARLSRDHHLQIAYHLWTFDPLDYYPRVTCPVLIVKPTDAETVEGYPYLVEAQRGLANSEIVVMSNTVHDVPWHRPVALVNVMRNFLQSRC
jgi:pimeloyl-ACP methyl ester carboxylesterase